MSARLTKEGEQRWQELRQHIDWSSGFSLFFYFTQNPQLADLLKSRLDNFLIGKSTRLQEITYQADEPQWLERTLDKLFQRDAHWQLLHSPVWVALHQNHSHDALACYRELLVRLNERRDLWRRQYHAPVIFLLPLALKPTCGSLAPDLWSIRAAAEVLGDELVVLSSAGDPTPTQTGYAQGLTGFVIPPDRQVLLDEWLRLEQLGKANASAIRAGQRAVQVWLDFRYLNLAQAAANKILLWSQQQNDTPESLRDLSVSLDNVGKVAQQQGRWSDAQQSYEESLGIRRRLCDLLGDTPESLRDVAVSLSNVASLVQEQGGLALPYYQEGLAIGERLMEMLPDYPEYSMVRGVFQACLEALVTD